MSRILLVLLAYLLLTGGAHAADGCLRDNVADQEVRGMLAVARAQDAAGRPERPYILQLDGAACLNTEDPQESVADAGTIHLYASDEALHARLKAFVGKMIRVRGTPFAAHTSHHHAPIVMDVSRIDAE